MTNEDTGRQAAEQFRREYGLGIAPISNLALLIERTVGIGVAYVSSEARGHGMTMRLDDEYLIAVGCTEHPMRLRGTLAHELGHFRLGTVDRLPSDRNWTKRSPEEIQADAFARHLLVPLRGVADWVRGKEVTLATLSAIVQSYLASPMMVAIQLRNVGAIDAATCEEWGKTRTGTLAARFGWHSEYQAQVEQSSKPKGPQALMARVMEGYRLGSVTAATVARLSGDTEIKETKKALSADGVGPTVEPLDFPALPTDTGDRLTPEELLALRGGTE